MMADARVTKITTYAAPIAAALFKTALKSFFKQAAIFSVALLALIEISSPLRAVETAPTPPSGPAAQAILRWFTTDRSLGCAPCTVEDNGPVFEVYYGDSTGSGPQADALAFVYYGPLPGGNMMDVNLAYFHRDGGGYRFIKTFPDVAGRGSIKGTTVRFLPGKASFTRAVKKADDPYCCATGRANYTVTLNPAPLTLPASGNAQSAAYPPGTMFTPKAGLPYDPKGMAAEYGPNWKNVLAEKDKAVAAWDADRAQKLQGAQQVVFSEDKNMAALIQTYPFLQITMKEPQKELPAPVYFAVSQGQGANLLFVETCNGCSLDVYLDEGTGYQIAYVDEGPGQKTATGSFYKGGAIYVSRIGGEITLFFEQPPNSPVMQWELINHVFETRVRPEN
jgi:hypothetical protein